MLGSTALVSRVYLALFILAVLFFLEMDLLLYARVRDYVIRPTANGTIYTSIVPCDLNPLCTVTVKGMLLDHPNHFLFSPLAALLDRLLGISRSWNWITPNMISGFHVFVAAAAGRCVSSDSLSYRRLGVVLFQTRTWLDDLDGHVARRRANISGERSDVGSPGYIVDGVCDAIGCVFFIIGLFHYVARNPTRRKGYDKLQQLPVFSSTTDSAYVATKTSLWNVALRSVLMLVGHLLLASVAWNRYISLYQDLLETDIRAPLVTKNQLYIRQTNVFRSDSFWAVSISWKIVNFHAAMDYLLIAIFVDRVWEYMKFMRWTAYIVILLLVYVSEFHYLRAYAYVREIPMVNLENETVSSVSVFTGR